MTHPSTEVFVAGVPRVICKMYRITLIVVLIFAVLCGVLLVGARYLMKAVPSIELKDDDIWISVRGAPINNAVITINGTFRLVLSEIHRGQNRVALARFVDHDGRGLTANEVDEIRIIGSRGASRLDTTIQFAHDNMSVSVQSTKYYSE